MAAALCVFSCHGFTKEVRQSIAAEGWTDVVALEFPSRCGRPPLTWEEMRALLPAECGQILVFGRACLCGLGTPPVDFPPVRLLPQEQCFHLVAGPSLVSGALADGGYLMTPGWLADWPRHLGDLGFKAEEAGEFFKDFARELVLFDTGVDAESAKHLGDFARVVGLPAKSLAVGLDHIRLLLARLVLEWRVQEAERGTREGARRHARELADHVSAMDLLAQLAQSQRESEAVSTMENIFRMLFAPSSWHYLRVERGQLMPDADVPTDVLARLETLDAPYAWTPSGQGFMLRIEWGERLLGLICLDGLAFPEHRERYVNLALSMTGVCALSIENARTRKRLVEAEKMASLAVMVAGVAHEINTPVGVGLTAASDLQRQSTRLAQRFAERCMTQSDLQSYLDRALAEAGLIRSNLERIAALVDAFRQVAVDGKPLSKRRFNLASCIADVIGSLGDRLPAAHVDTRVLCDAGLEIESYPGDWASIFTNLITNSLRHAFKGREKGVISIGISVTPGRLEIDYADDGTGLSTEAQARIFDPFFTTDLQHGTGLGMHLVYNLVTHRLGGSIASVGQPGQGARFHLEIPL